MFNVDSDSFVRIYLILCWAYIYCSLGHELLHCLLEKVQQQRQQRAVVAEWL